MMLIDRIGELKIPMNVVVIVCVLVAGLIAAYVLWPTGRDIVTFSGAGIGAGALTLTAFYTARALHVAIKQTESVLKYEKIQRALKYSERWNDPNFGDLRAKWRTLVKEVDGKPPNEICSILEDLVKRTVAVDILNFFEEMSYAVKTGVVDDDILRKLFKSVCIHYFSCIQAWIVEYRQKKNQPLAWEHFEWLKNIWQV
jgi:hypothetical protein